MQGQSSPVQTLAKNFLTDNGSTSSADEVDRQMPWNGLQNSSVNRLPDYHVARNAEWCFGESSSGAARRLRNVSVEDHQERPYDFVGIPPLDVIKLSSSTSQTTDGLYLSQNPVSHTQDLNMNAEYEDEDEDEDEDDDDEDDDDGDRPIVFKTLDLADEQRADSLELVSGYRGFVMGEREEEDGPGFSLNVPRRLPCKRKAMEVQVGGQSSGSLDFSERAQRHHQWLPAEEGLGTNHAAADRGNLRIRIGVGESVSANPPFPNAPSENGESSIRNPFLHNGPFRFQDSVPGNQFLTDVDVRSSSGTSSSRLPLRDYLFDSTPAPGGGLSRRTISPAVSSETRSISEHPVFVPGSEIGTLLEQQIANWNSSSSLSSSSSSLEGTMGSTYRPGSSSSGPRHSSSSSLRSARYHQRLSEMMRRSLMSSSPVSESATAPVGIPSLPENHRRRSSASSRSLLLERHLEGFPQLRSLAAASSSSGEGRRNMMTEQIRHVLDLMRRGESLRLEDMMILDHSLFGMTEIHDRHRDMRMDVDNMSYEELLALEERIGNVCTGLTEEAIASNLKRRKYSDVVFSGVEIERAAAGPCCICREEYVAGEDVGELNCSHEFHADCIKQWLMQKNLCPICKTTGLNK